MRALTASEIIELWETVHHFHSIDQALALLMRVMPEHSRDELAALPLGQRDALLLALRQATFGDDLPGQASCPQCAERVGFELSCSALLQATSEPQERQMSQDGYSLRIRPLNSFDLAAAAAAPSVSQARGLLLECAVLDAQYQGEAIAVDALPQSIESAVSQQLSATDPQAEWLLDLDCPACHHLWQDQLDITHLLWLEVAARARRLLMEVHLLARAYAWREADILNLTPARRAAYLQMVTA